MQEYKIQTSSFDAEYGRTPGTQLSIVTRRGTNQLHGTSFEDLRNEVFDANTWFNNDADLTRAAEKQNDFGGVIAGPAWRDKLFFFFSYEGFRLRVPESRQDTSRTVILLCSFFLGRPIHAFRFRKVRRSIMRFAFSTKRPS